jgi:hypothetical protein
MIFENYQSGRSFIMKKILLTIVFIITTYVLGAHSPQLSTVTLTQSEGNKWNLIIGSSLSAFQYELRNSYPKQKTDSMNPVQFQKAVLQHLRQNIRIIPNGQEAVSLKNGMVILGHQTDVKFDLVGMPKELTSLDFTDAGFATLRDHYCLLKIIINRRDSGSFILHNDNKYFISALLKNNIFVEKLTSFNVNWLIVGGVILTAVCVLGYKSYR